MHHSLSCKDYKFESVSEYSINPLLGEFSLLLLLFDVKVLEQSAKIQQT